MSRFNNTAVNIQKTVNLAGGEACVESQKLELVSILLTSFLDNKFYRSGAETLLKYVEVLQQVDPIFAAKAAIYARTQLGMRSITHVLAAELTHSVKDTEWVKFFIEKVIYRPDDMLEIMSYYLTRYGKPIPSSMKRGFAMAFNKFNGYQLAKYRGEGKDLTLVDLVNLVHPKPQFSNEEALRKLMHGELVSTETWESMMTQAGQKASSEEEKALMKAKVWGDLLTSNKLGYFALLRNLSNIAIQAPQFLDLALEQLICEKAIKGSLVLPFRFQTAYDIISGRATTGTPTFTNTKKDINQHLVAKIIHALDIAATISLSNIPSLKGDTLIAVDVSGSMVGKPNDIASMFAAALFKKLDADVLTFAHGSEYVILNKSDGVLSLSEKLRELACGGGTNFQSIFSTANRKYDRVIILSDMQGWMANGGRSDFSESSPKTTFGPYKTKFDADPKVWSFDLSGLGTLQFPERNVYALAGFSDKIFDLMNSLEEDRNAMINKIEGINFYLDQETISEEEEME